jgi:hypothetical protein
LLRGKMRLPQDATVPDGCKIRTFRRIRSQTRTVCGEETIVQYMAGITSFK